MFQKTILRNISIVLGYFILARLSLLLAIPPGYSSPIWPSTGIALAGVLIWGYRVLPGIYLGAFLVNVLPIFGSLPHPGLDNIYVIYLFLPLLACICAGIPAYIIQELHPQKQQVYLQNYFWSVFLIGGPVGGAISGTLGPLGLWLFDIVSSSQLSMNMFTWWVGDCLGVILITPLLLVLFKGKNVFSVRRKVLLLVPSLLLFVISILLFSLAKTHESDKLRIYFHQIVSEQAESLSNHLTVYSNIMVGIEALFNASEYVSWNEFNTFVGTVVEDVEGIQAIEWVPQISFEDQHHYVQMMKEIGYDGYSIYDIDHKHDFIQKKDRQYAYPVYYVYPYEGNGRAHGLDLGSSLSRLMAIRHARDTALSRATGRIRLVQDEKEQDAFLYYQPIYRKGVSLSTEEDRKAHFLGVALGVFIVPDIVHAAFNPENNCFTLRILDRSAPPGDQFLFGDAAQADDPMMWEHSYDMGGRDWVFQFFPLESCLSGFSWLSYSVLIFALIINSLLVMMIISLTLQTLNVEQEVTIQTKFLSDALEKLSQSHDDLERFVYVVSHDLREPLRSIVSFSEEVTKNYAQEIEDQGQKYLDMVVASGLRLQALIKDLLDYSRVPSEAPKLERIDLNELMAHVQENLGIIIKEHQAKITIKETLPSVISNPVRLTRVIQNLIENGIKYQPSGQTPSIEISTLEDDAGTYLSIKDNGIGIKSDFYDRIFEPFKRLHNQKQYPGSGLGLSICQKLIRSLGGSLRVVSEVGVGSVFTVFIPNKEDEKL